MINANGFNTLRVGRNQILQSFSEDKMADDAPQQISNINLSVKSQYGFEFLYLLTSMTNLISSMSSLDLQTTGSEAKIAEFISLSLCFFQTKPNISLYMYISIDR